MTSCCENIQIESFLELFKSLSDQSRLAIFKYFCDCCSSGKQECNVSEVSTCCDLDLSVISRHLKKLKSASILSSRKEGKEVLYSLNFEKVTSDLRTLADLIEQSFQKGEKDE